MAVTAYLYDTFPQYALKKQVSDLSDVATTVKVALCSNSYTPSQASHESYNDITDELAAGNGYTVGGATLASKTLTTTTHVTTFAAGDAQWLNSTFTARYAIIYDATPATATAKKLIGYIDFGADFSSSASTFQIVFNASGIFTFTVA